MIVGASFLAACAGTVLLAAVLLGWLCLKQKAQLISIRAAFSAKNSLPQQEAPASELVHAEPGEIAPGFAPADLDAAVAAGQFRLFYQPKVCARTGQTISVEALIRWFHPLQGLISPAQFIPFAERTGRMRVLTDWVLGQAVLDQPRFGVPVYVNISGPLLCDANFIDGALEIIKGLESNIGFEITETAVIQDPEHALAQLARLVDAKVNIAIDDYGVGVSSLTYLKQLPANELKIDQAFIRDISRSNRDPLLVRSTIDLAHALDMRVTAEGVEDAAAHALLRVMGCDYIQGYLTGRPMPAEQLEEFLAGGPQPIAVVVPRFSAQA